MSSILEHIQALQAWRTPRRPSQDAEADPFLLSVSFGPPPAPGGAVLEVDKGLQEFWSHAASADLFKDETYGQWGLHILSPAAALDETREQLAERPEDFFLSDLVIGTFFGDSDLLLIDRSRAVAGACPVLVALPLDPRDDWPEVATSFSEFLGRYIAVQGDKYWD